MVKAVFNQLYLLYQRSDRPKYRRELCKKKEEKGLIIKALKDNKLKEIL